MPLPMAGVMLAPFDYLSDGLTKQRTNNSMGNKL